jgi:hypothetical protein
VHSEKKVQEKKLLVIPVGEGSRKKQKSALPSQNTEAAEAAVAEAKAKAAPTVFGLNVQKQSEDADPRTSEEGKPETKDDKPEVKKSADEEALEVLLGKKAASNAVIPTLVDEETFHKQYDVAPDAPTEADYDAVPIEEFGAAMLRGMGWKDGEAIGRNKGQAPLKSRTLERRPELLGVGAKPAKALGIELGEWGKHAKKHERKIDQAYAPVMLKNKQTGEMITEEEMQKRLKEQEMGLIDEPEDDGKDERRKEKDRRQDKEREKDRDRDYDDRRRRTDDDEGDRRRRRDDDENDRRRRKDHDDSDRERRERRREKERRRRDRSESEDRHRSRRDDKYRDKDRERRHRDDDRSFRKERSHTDRSDRDRR